MRNRQPLLLNHWAAMNFHPTHTSLNVEEKKYFAWQWWEWVGEWVGGGCLLSRAGERRLNWKSRIGCCSVISNKGRLQFGGGWLWWGWEWCDYHLHHGDHDGRDDGDKPQLEKWSSPFQIERAASSKLNDKVNLNLVYLIQCLSYMLKLFWFTSLMR